jgi:hypothetical protein
MLTLFIKKSSISLIGVLCECISSPACKMAYAKFCLVAESIA